MCMALAALPIESQSGLFSPETPPPLPIPIFHVNAEDPDVFVRIGRLALEYRHTFGTDVVVDLIGFRRHGHSEVDDPTITQPLLYRKIKDHPQLWQIYAQRIGVDAKPLAEQVRGEYETAQRRAGEAEKKAAPHAL